MMQRSTWAIRVVAVLGVSALAVLASCGGGGDGGAGGAGGSASPSVGDSTTTAPPTAAPGTGSVADSAGGAGGLATTPPTECRYVDVVPVPPPADLDMRVGDCGPGVNQVQQLLSYLGYSIGLDGEFGPATEAVVRQYQTGAGLDATGVVDAESFSQLDYDATP